MRKRKKRVKKRIVGYVFRPWRRDPRTGKILYARNYGLKAWKIPVYSEEAA